MNQIRTIGVIGYGRFGSFYVNDILPLVFPDAQVRIASHHLTDERVSVLEEVAQSDLIIPAVPIRAMKQVLKELALHVHSHSVVMDVCSVKVSPAAWMKELVPEHISLIASHPMFGSSSYHKVNTDVSQLKLVMYPLRILPEQYAVIKSAFEKHCRVIEMSPDEHDQKVAQFQFISHLVGSMLHRMDLKRSLIDTESASSMFDMMEVLNTDSLELLEDMYQYNAYASGELDKFRSAYQLVTGNLKP